MSQGYFAQSNNIRQKLLILASFFLAVIFSGFGAPIYASEENDAIAIRIVDNPNHYSIERWYQMYGPAGTPQSLQVDGYDAIRNGRTVYINAANIVDSNNDTIPDAFYTHIFLLSYAQDQQETTTSIFVNC